MLKQIYIENFALIDSLELEFEDGLTIFTGETGSGKSIMIDAISFAIGKRADRAFVRTGKQKATIELTFFVDDNIIGLLQKTLDEEDIKIPDNIIILKREIFSDGRSLCKVNSKNVTISVLRNISSYLINIHGQNEFNELDEANHINILDSFLKIKKTKEYETYIKEYIKYVKLKNEYDNLYKNYDKERNKKELDFLNFQIDEIEGLKLKKDEDKKIESELKILENSQRISQSVNGLYDSLYEDTPNVLAIFRKYSEIFFEFGQLDESLNSLSQKLSEEYYNIEELVYDLRDNLGKYNFDENRKLILEDRYNEINRIYSKYARGYENLKNYLENIKKEVEFYNRYEEKIIDIKKEISQISLDMEKSSYKLYQMRQLAKEKLETMIVKELETLGMKNVTFIINIKRTEEFTSKGKDEVVFLISFNKGQEPMPFSKVASGGEISRFMLALKNAITSDYEKTMVFDEIDTGISGIASERVGRKLQDISRERQVLCITHQGQIASYAKHHIEVYKETIQNSTRTKAKILDYDQRIVEIAKMMDASTNSVKSLEHAKELLGKNSLR